MNKRLNINNTWIINYRAAIVIVILVMIGSLLPCWGADTQDAPEKPDHPIIQEPDCKSAVVMEASTGEIIYEFNADQPLPPASMVKMMVIYIIMEKLEEGTIKLSDIIQTSAHASRMGGSQVYLKHKEKFTLEEILKAIVIQSANDASMAAAEYIGGSSKGFVDLMNAEAYALGMKNTEFHSPHGLPPGNNQSADKVSARDFAILARAIVTKYPEILEMSSREKEGFRGGEFIMTNTNHLIRTFQGCDGLKTGYYYNAGFSVTATACRNDVRIIAVVMGCEKSEPRFSEAARLMSWGFNQYKVVTIAEKNQSVDQVITIESGVKTETTPILARTLKTVVNHHNKTEITQRINMAETLVAPIESGFECGAVSFYIGDRELGEIPLIIAEDIEKLSWWGSFLRWVGFG